MTTPRTLIIVLEKTVGIVKKFLTTTMSKESINQKKIRDVGREKRM